MALIHRTPELNRQDFAEKRVLLGQVGAWVSPSAFYSAVLHCEDYPDKPTMLVEAGATFRVMPLDQIVAVATEQRKNNWYISMADYFQNALKKKLLDALHAFVMDLDYIRPGGAQIILDGIVEGLYPKPTYVVNSGGGLHFYYVLDGQLQMYRQQRRQAGELLSVMHDQYKAVYGQIGLAQKHWIGQPYRVVGSSSKDGDIVEGYAYGDMWAIDALAQAFGYVWEAPLPRGVKQPPTDRMVKMAQNLADQNGAKLPDLSNFRATYRFIGEEMQKSREMGRQMQMRLKETEGKRWVTPSADWYNRTVMNIIEKSREGWRYSSLMALSVIAIKCDIPLAQLEDDVSYIAYIWEERADKFVTPFNAKNLDSAVKMHNPKYRKVTRKQLEEWLGWEFKTSNKRNGRKQELHLKLARANRDILQEEEGKVWYENSPHSGRKSKKDQVKAYLIEHQNGKPKECILETGLNKNTVYKWWKVAMKEIRKEREGDNA